MTPALLSMLAGCSTLAEPGSVTLRGQGNTPPQSGEIASMSPAGLLLKTSADEPGRLFAWDAVRLVEGPLATQAAPYLILSGEMMRARTRMERGDTWLADQVIEPLYEQAAAAKTTQGFVGPTGLLLAECELRSCLARKASAGATLAWLQWSAVDRTRPKPPAPNASSASREPQWIGGSCNLPPIVDPGTGLCPQLPPLFSHLNPASVGTLRVLTQSAQLKRLAADGAPSQVFAAAYALAARISAGEIQPGESVSLPTANTDAERLVVDMVASQTAPSDLMRAARQRLQKRLETLQRDTETRDTADDTVQPDRSWQRAWLHAAIGRSLMAEDQASLRRQGMVESLHVPAIDGATQPMLAVVAIMDVIEQLHAEGGESNDAAIAALCLDLKTRFGVEAPQLPERVEPAPATTPVPPSSLPPSKEVP